MPALLILALLQAAPAAGEATDAYHARTSIEPRCPTEIDTTTITVCGMRQADRYRVPLIVHDAGDPMHESVMAERTRLMAPTDNCREKSLFLVGCGSAGVGVSTSARGTGVYGLAERPIAP